MPAAFEPPSASFVLDWGSIRAMRARGIVFATITLAAGISSTGDSELDRCLPFDEAYRIPDPTASAIRQGRAAGGRIIAIGTTVVRALEHAARQGGVRAGEGRTAENRGPRRAWFARWGGNTGEPRDASTRWDYWPGASWIRLARVMTECQAMHNRLRVACFALAICVFGVRTASAQATLELRDFLVLPMTGLVDGKVSNEQLLSRVNTLREEVGGAKRLFISDLNGPLYILDKDTRKLTVYLNFNGNEGMSGIFRKLRTKVGLGNGLNGFYLDPDYTRNGRFYTVHMEDPSLAGSNLPNNAGFPAFKVAGYTTTEAIKTPGPLQNEGVLIEWTDSDPSNSTFEGTARELLRVQLNTTSHPLGDLIFNPTARRGDPDWRVLYMECGDGASGESTDVAIRSNPQRLDNLEGKILRIIPDLSEHAATSTVSANGRYRIPNDNPFVSTPGARTEIWAYGFRNPHRLNWAVDPANPANNRLIANSVGLHTWETVYIVHKGANYGYGEREGNELLKADNTTAPLPQVDKIPMRIGEQATGTMVVPTYPVIQYGHGPGGGDSIGSGFVYNGKAMPALRGKYVFTDLTTGRIWYADYKDMLAADDGKPGTLAAIHEVKLLWNDPHDSPDAGKKVYDSMFPIVEAAYHARGGGPRLPARADLVKGGRADVRFSIDANGELYLYSKSDGIIRAVVEAIGF